MAIGIDRAGRWWETLPNFHGLCLKIWLCLPKLRKKASVSSPMGRSN
jgi:hypothetical protein